MTASTMIDVAEFVLHRTRMFFTCSSIYGFRPCPARNESRAPPAGNALRPCPRLTPPTCHGYDGMRASADETRCSSRDESAGASPSFRDLLPSVTSRAQPTLAKLWRRPVSCANAFNGAASARMRDGARSRCSRFPASICIRQFFDEADVNSDGRYTMIEKEPPIFLFAIAFANRRRNTNYASHFICEATARTLRQCQNCENRCACATLLQLPRKKLTRSAFSMSTKERNLHMIFLFE